MNEIIAQWLIKHQDNHVLQNKSRLETTPFSISVGQVKNFRKGAAILAIVMGIIPIAYTAGIFRMLDVGIPLSEMTLSFGVIFAFTSLALLLVFLGLSRYVFDFKAMTVSHTLFGKTLSRKSINQLTGVKKVNLNFEENDYETGLKIGSTRLSSGVRGMAYIFSFDDGRKYRIGTFQVDKEIELIELLSEEFKLPVTTQIA